MRSRRLAVLILSWEYPPIVEGGLARHVGKLSRALAENGVDVHVLTRGNRLAPTDEELDGVRVHRAPEADWPADPDRFVAWVGQMNRDLLVVGSRLSDRVAFDLVHGHDWLVAEAAEGLADRLGCPLVMTIHATEYGRHQGWIVGQPQARIHAAERQAVHRADRVIACSEFMRGHVADVFSLDERRIAVIPNGVDGCDLEEPDSAEPLEGSTLRLRFATPAQPLVLMVGRLVYEKGFQIALEALPALIGRVPGLRFVVAGAGVHEVELKAQADRLGLGRHGSFIGWAADDLLRSLYRIADVCVIPSIYEPCGLVALEAMACGCPCVVADTGGLREVVPHEQAGLRFTSRDPRALTASVERLLGDATLRQRLVTKASEHVRSFDWTLIAQTTAALYEDVSTEAGPG
jgi:glycogen synthase